MQTSGSRVINVSLDSYVVPRYVRVRASALRLRVNRPPGDQSFDTSKLYGSHDNRGTQRGSKPKFDKRLTPRP